MTEEQLVKACISGNASAQKEFYDLFWDKESISVALIDLEKKIREKGLLGDLI